jgi:hypothetical protein
VGQPPSAPHADIALIAIQTAAIDNATQGATLWLLWRQRSGTAA